MENDKIREAFEKWYESYYSTKISTRYSYDTREDEYTYNIPRGDDGSVDVLNSAYEAYKSAMQSAQEEIERLKKENEDLKCCGNCGIRLSCACCTDMSPKCEDWQPPIEKDDNWEPK